jgi:PPK2 family polyphosphate:nucleotide phosphotransferase
MKIKIADNPSFDKTLVKKQIKHVTREMLKEIGKLQYKMYGQNKYSLLIIFQGIDASGKDGATKDILEFCNAVGIKIHSFKKPTEEEFAHDFLRRVHAVTPGRGEMQIFVRSHYEDILVPTVEKYIPDDIIEERYEQINNFEKLVESNNTRILKFFLNVSKEAQKERLMERIESKKKHWKHKDSDWVTREKFDDYMNVYEKVLNRCNDIPWHIVPSDKNWQKTYFVAQVLLKTLKELDLKWPELVSEKFTEGKSV